MFERFFKRKGDYFYFVFRVVVGILFTLHGAGKFGIIGDGSIGGFAGGMGLPLWMAVVAGGIELLGGLAIMLGVFTRLSAVGGIIVMVAAWFMSHAPKGWYPLANGGEKVLLFIAAFVLITAYGARKWSLERAILKKEVF